MRAAWPAVLLAASCAGAPARTKTTAVTAEGWAPIERRDPAGARARAIEDALKRAVEQGAGLDLSARVKVRAGIVSSAALDSRTAGRVVSYAVLEEGPSLGAWRVRVRAQISREKLRGRPAPPVPLRVVGEPVAAEALGAALLRRGWELTASTQAVRVDAETSVSSADDPRLAPLLGRRARVGGRATTPEGRTLWSSRAEAAALSESSDDADHQATAAAAALLAEDADASLREALWDR